MLLELLESAQSPELLEWIQSEPIILDSFLQNHKVHCAFYQNMDSMVMTETSLCVCVCVCVCVACHKNLHLDVPCGLVGKDLA